MMHARLLSKNKPANLARQRQLVRALHAHGYFLHHARMQETHISWVLLAGHDAYKIKKAVNLGFLDFSSLASRQFYCNEELRLNHRLAPGLYLDVVAIGGSAEHPVLGGKPAIEYAVHMRRFAQSNMMNRMLARDSITSDHIDRLATVIAQSSTSCCRPPPQIRRFARQTG